MLEGMKMTALLRTSDGVVRLCEDRIDGSCSIGLRTSDNMEYKFISKELHDLLVKEIGE